MSDNQMWLAQLLNINKGTRFYLTALPIYQSVKNEPEKVERLKMEFDEWINMTHGKYIHKSKRDYLRVK